MKKFLLSLASATVLLLAATPPNPTVASQRIPEFENSEVRVWKSIINPEAPLTMHRHDHPRVLVALTGGDMKLVPQSGPSEMNHWKPGHAYWLPAMPPGQLHEDVNAGSKPIEVIVVELKNAHEQR